MLNRLISNRMAPKRLRWVGASLLVTGVVVGARATGLLTGLELTAFDLLLQLRPLQEQEQRIVLVMLKEADVQALDQAPVSDQVMANLITKIKQQNPRVVGLDFYRNIPLEPGRQQFLQVVASTPNLVGIEKIVADKAVESVPGNQVLAKNQQLAASDIVLDPDGRVRRGLLFLSRPDGTVRESLALRLALDYLSGQGIEPDPNAEALTLNGVKFPMFSGSEGGYVAADAGGYQMIHNPRSNREPFVQVSFLDVLENRIPPGLLTDKVVLIGNGAAGDADFFFTSHSNGFDTRVKPISGVELHASLTSQIISAALDGRPLIHGSSPLIDGILILGLSLLAGSMNQHQDQRRQLMVGGLVGSLIVGSYIALWQGIWLPLLPMLAAAVATTGAVMVMDAQQLRQLSDRDELTQLANRRVFNRLLASEWQRGLRSQTPLAVILCDVDQFKLYNDHYGHPQGDVCLRQVGLSIQESMRRTSDCAARYGGEEFVVLLPNTDGEGALQVAEQIRQMVLRKGLAHQHSTVHECVTLSLGVASIIPQEQYSTATLLQEADLGLYEAKKKGRNQAVLRTSYPA
jgi:adenylate cyclase